MEMVGGGGVLVGWECNYVHAGVQWYKDDMTMNISYVQVAIPQLIPGGQFPYFATGQPIPGYYIPQTIATQSPYLQAGLPGYPFSSFGASYPQGYFG
jgi:hypothetical protein